MIDPEADLDAIQAALIADTDILSCIGLTVGSTAVQKADHIIKRMAYTDLDGKESRICIYFIPGRTTRNNAMTTDVLHIEIHVPNTQDHLARRAVNFIKKRIHKRAYNKWTWYIEASLGELFTAPGYYCHGCRFVSNKTY